MTLRKMAQDWTEIRRFTLLFNIINTCGSNCFYSGKIMAFTCSVLGTFYAIRFGLTDLLSCGVAMLAFQAIMFYLLCLGNAYVIPQTMDSALQHYKLMSSIHVGRFRKELRQRIRSVRHLTIMEGGFRGVGRGTTPEFVDFYTKEVIALVLAFAF